MTDFAETLPTAVGPLQVVSGSSMADALRRSPEHDPGVHFFMRRHRDRLFPFFDVGANCGYFSVLASRLGGPVISIEADPRNAELLRANAPDAIVYEVACGAKDGSIRMGAMPCGLSAKAKDDATDIPARSVRSIADELRVEPSFVKMDIEGGETDALLGIQSPAAILEIEFSWRDHGSRFDEWLTVRPPAAYNWTFLLSPFEEYRHADRTEISGKDYFLASADDDSTLFEIVDALRRSTEQRHSRKWELCINPKPDRRCR